MNAQPKSEKLCPYCARTVEKLTRDHIVSRGLFVPPYPDNLPTVKVCEKCNHAKGDNEDYLRDFLILNIEASGSTVARTLAKTALTRAVLSPQSYGQIRSGDASRGKFTSLLTGKEVEVQLEIAGHDVAVFSTQ